MIRFLFNDQLREVDDLAPDLTILEYLRTVEVQRGTKEGCASGDCGACTVVVAEPSSVEGSADGSPEGSVTGKLTYKSVNSCITFVGSLHGKQLITIEALKAPGQPLHPAQQAMVDCHGSQCGFCTPGFVMSLFALSKNSTPVTAVNACDPANPDAHTRHDIDLALGGNLCRCTGYRPIIEAAGHVLAAAANDHANDHFNHQEAQTWQQLRDLASATDTGSLNQGDRHFFVPQTLQQLLDLRCQYPHGRLVAGGTDLALEYTQQLKPLDVLIYTGQVAELQHIQVSNSRLMIGAGVSYSAVMDTLKQHLPEFARMMERLGALQVRNQGTMAGNVANASPIGDTPPVLLALDAIVHVHSPAGASRIAIKDFFSGYRQTCLPAGGVISQIEIPLDKTDWHRCVFKVSKRFEDDISAVLAALMFKVENDVITAARLAFGGVAATPLRVEAAEQALIGQPATLAGIRAAQTVLAQTLTPLTDVRASAAYRLQLVQNLLARAVLEYQQPHATLEVAHYA
ncbi:xanthine dehydrogenase small subunit [Oceanobacter antarcticus]|uniref:Xanthine dehydrogenase small subunit n=1 Tax=Oceanobacter antarcticus TaxID=3133425 RepID=A0ABW8NFM4_9GAMM